MIKYVFFDFNGTILNDVDLCLNLLNQILAKQGHKSISLEEYKNIFTFPIKRYYELAGIDFSKDSFEDLSKWFINKYQKASFNCPLYPHLLEVLTKLKEKGIQRIVLSASQLTNLCEQLEVLNIKDEFNNILGLDNIYAASKLEVARKFIEDNNINSQEVLAVGDTLHDYEVASTLHFNSLLFSEGHQSIEVLKKANRPIINDLIEILKYID